MYAEIKYDGERVQVICFAFNTLTPRSDKEWISLKVLHKFLVKKVVRTKKVIMLKIKNALVICGCFTINTDN